MRMSNVILLSFKINRLTLLKNGTIFTFLESFPFKSPNSYDLLFKVSLIKLFLRQMIEFLLMRSQKSWKTMHTHEDHLCNKKFRLRENIAIIITTGR